jgi:hypothetical protein
MEWLFGKYILQITSYGNHPHEFTGIFQNFSVEITGISIKNKIACDN